MDARRETSNARLTRTHGAYDQAEPGARGLTGPAHYAHTRGGPKIRSALGLAASALAGVAAIVASQDGDTDIVLFFVGLTFLGAVTALASHQPVAGWRRGIARGAAMLWIGAATWVAVLLVMFITMQASRPPPEPEDTYLGLTATVYHLVGLYGGAVLVAFAAFAPDRWVERTDARET